MKSKNEKLLVICGPTSTGKTELGIYLANKFNGEIISADSRQVYRGMDIGTGKLRSTEVQIWGYDLVDPNDDFSVSHFQKYAANKIAEILNRNKLPILVGGTGLYIKAVTAGIQTANIPVNKALRTSLEDKSAEELFEILKQVNLQKALSLNNSDSKNPRRLIRAIEISSSVTKENQTIKYDTLTIGLKSSLDHLFARIDKSIKKRLENGFEDEVLFLKKHIAPNSKAMTATGYQVMLNYLSGEIGKKEMIEKWSLSEKQYVKRQLTWFNKQSNINWFDIKDLNYKTKVVELVKIWENK